MANVKYFGAALIGAAIGAVTAGGGAVQAASLANPHGSSKAKVCTNTYHAGGIRCTTCTYTAINETTVHCIKIKTNSSNSGSQSSVGSLLRR
jgi:hypothetical protein